MATKLANAMGGPNGQQHTSGIFADMTVDGPEIGTLVIIVDRAKNLPNRKSMGKQSAYCAARLGKEAKKTETDKRGGQTPKWDQELRFTVHDSPDYHNLKISVFSEDKRTDLVGEAWVSLADVIVPGGGKSDIWQGLNCKGKYAGEIRFELTYYDSRPKPERSHRDSVAAEEESMRQSSGGASRVKRRPLPSNPNSGSMTPDAITDVAVAMPGRAKHGPRDLGAPTRANSMPPEVGQHQTPQQPMYPPPLSYGSSPQLPQQQTPPNQYYDEPQQQYPEQPYDDPYQQPDFLPQLPPSNRQRAPTHQRLSPRQAQPSPLQPRPQSHIGLPHSYSAPVVPLQQHSEPQSYDDGYQLSTDYPEPIPVVEYQHRQLRQRRMDVPPEWQDEYGDPYGLQQTEDNSPPPPPPMHSNSAPIVPRFASHSQQPSPASGYGNTPPSARHHSVPSASPLQSIERRYGQPQQTSPQARGRSVDDYASSPEQSPYGATPPSLMPGQSPSPYAKGSAGRGLPPRHHSVADLYGNMPHRPHPLSQEVPRARSPLPQPAELRGSSPQPYNQQAQYQHDYRGRDGAAPLIKPRPLSPRPGPPPQEQPTARPRSSRSSYGIQFPVRAFESGDNSPLSTAQQWPLPPANRTPTTRKSVSPRPSPSDAGRRSGGGGMPFSPDSFDVHNPNAPRTTPLGTSPHTPYQASARSGAEASSASRQEPNGPIVGWHGQEIDPSDHLPVDSWAPEPKKKTPTKTYGLGRDRDFGPRSSAGGAPTGVSPGGGRLGKDTVINFRMKSGGGSASESETSPTKNGGPNRLVKKSTAAFIGNRGSNVEPLREHANFNSVPDPYAGQAEYSRGFMDAGARPSHGGGPPGVPPKIPLQQQYPPSGYGPEYDDPPPPPAAPGYGGQGYGRHDYGYAQDDALAREISSIDIGSGSGSGAGAGRGGWGGREGRPTNASVPSPTAYVPVRSQRDRGSYY